MGLSALLGKEQPLPPGPQSGLGHLLYPFVLWRKSREKRSKFYSLKKCPFVISSKRSQPCSWKRPAVVCYRRLQPPSRSVFRSSHDPTLPHIKPGRDLLHSGTDLQLCPWPIADTACLAGWEVMSSPRAGTQAAEGSPCSPGGQVKPTLSQCFPWHSSARQTVTTSPGRPAGAFL